MGAKKHDLFGVPARVLLARYYGWNDRFDSNLCIRCRFLRHFQPQGFYYGRYVDRRLKLLGLNLWTRANIYFPQLGLNY
jgi:hypothetical protein